MPEEALKPTDENVMKFVFGDEVSSAHLREVAQGPATSAYRQVITTNGPLWERRDRLGYRTTALVNLAILAGLNRPRELFTRVVGLLRGGISVEEIQEVFLHIGFYCGNPAGVEANVALHDAMKNLTERGIAFNQSKVEV